MSKVCVLTGKKAMKGHKVSHSNIKTNRKFYPNLQDKKFFVPELNCWIRMKVSTSAIKNINKKGIYACLKDAANKGLI